MLFGSRPNYGWLWRLLTKSSFRRKLNGGAYVIDGDTIRVNGESIRLHGIDAPEIGQDACDSDGEWYDQGEYVKNHLVNFIGGKQVQVEVTATDKYRRLVGIVTCEGIDVNQWLVSNGFAIAAYGDSYKGAERRARWSKRGIWNDTVSYDPRNWRANRSSR